MNGMKVQPKIFNYRCNM